MDCFDAGITSEVFLVEGENSRDAVDAHGCHQSRVVNLHARNGKCDEKSAPFLVNRKTVGQ